MGCCVSTPSQSASPYPTAAASSSSRAINNSHPASASALPRPSTTHTHRSSQNQPRPRPPLGERYSSPLRLHVWESTDRTWTRQQLDEEREAFFHTRVTLRPEIWQTLHAALEILWTQARTPGSDEEEAVALAQSILEAAGITLTTGDISNGSYDSFGSFYTIPAAVVADPTNIVDASEDTEDKGIEDEGGLEDTEEDGDDVIRRRLEKGKAVIPDSDLLKIKARLSDGAQDVIVHVGKNDSTRLVRGRIMYQCGFPTSKKIKLLYMGKYMKEEETLLAQGWQQGHTINVFLFG